MESDSSPPPPLLEPLSSAAAAAPQEPTVSSATVPPSAAAAAEDQALQETAANDPPSDPLSPSAVAPPPQELAVSSAIVPPSSATVAEDQALQETAANDPPSDATTPAPPPDEVLSDDLRDKIVRQVEYYFSDVNLPTDDFLLKFVKRDKKGFVPIAVIASFRKMKKLVQNFSLIEAALRTSTQLVVSVDGKKVRRLHPLPATEARTVLVENLPEDCSTDLIQRIFGSAGKIANIMVQDPHAVEESAVTRKAKMAFSSKLHALVEYETVEAAENAVATLNDEKNWRSGLRVQLLLRRMGKYGSAQRGHKEKFEKNDTQASDIAVDGQKLKPVEHNVEVAENEERNSAGCKGERKGRGKSRGKGYHQKTTNGHGRGNVPSSFSSEGASKPIPGPRMPDGTRGFTMGRGKPIIMDQNT